MEPITVLELHLPATEAALTLWAHACFIWIVVNYAHRLDSLDRVAARNLDAGEIRRWRAFLVLRAASAGLLVTFLTSFGVGGILLGLLIGGGAYALPEVRLRSMRSSRSRGWQDLRAEWEIALNILAVMGTALFIGSTEQGLEVGLLSVPLGRGDLISLLLAGSGAVFLLRGGTHIVRGVLEKSDTFPDSTLGEGMRDLRHGVTIGNIERILIFLFALVGSHAAIGLVVAAKGVVRAVEWKERALVEYFLIGTLASAGLAVAVGIAVRSLITGT